MQLKNKVLLIEKTGNRAALKTCLNLVITGNPGTGKTSFARLLFRFLYVYGVLPKNNFVEKNALELKGQAVGQTAPRVIDAVNQAKGGCLFLDEAYALIGHDVAGSHSDPFSQDAVRTLLTEVENNRTNLMVVLAGYKDKIQRLLRADPGLPSRFPKSLHLPDYSANELAQVCSLVAKKRYGLDLVAGLESRLAKHIFDFHAFAIAEQNARLAVNLVEAAVEKQMDRLGAAWAVEQGERENGMPARMQTAVLELNCGELLDEDFGISQEPTIGDVEERQKIEAEVTGMIGMPSAKAFFLEIKKMVEYVEGGGNPQILRTSLNMVITGNPGTGKTTIARLIARYLNAFGVLPRANFVERNGLELKGQYVCWCRARTHRTQHLELWKLTSVDMFLGWAAGMWARRHRRSSRLSLMPSAARSSSTRCGGFW